MAGTKWAVFITAADGTPSAAGPFPSKGAAERWAARLELATEGDLGGFAAELESPAKVMEDAQVSASLIG